MKENTQKLNDNTILMWLKLSMSGFGKNRYRFKIVNDLNDFSNLNDLKIVNDLKRFKIVNNLTDLPISKSFKALKNAI